MQQTGELMAIMPELVRGLSDLVISGPKNGSEYTKIRIRPIMLRGEVCYQASCYTAQQVFHENLSESEVASFAAEKIEASFKQAQLQRREQGFEESVTILVSKKGKVTVRRKKTHIATEDGCAQGQQKIQDHNRKKRYILEEGIPVPFLVDLGVMTAEGKIVRSRYDKYRQINRFLEFIEDILPELPKGRELTLIDFGCGKSYLTFAMYYYLHELKGYELRVFGLDLKEKVIEDCQKLAERYGYEGLHFLCGDIADFEGVEAVDMVVTLHACDTATDFALAKAVGWKASVILSVPCCQHELNRQMQCDTLSGAFRYGIIQERTAALMTDALRAQLLELSGYKVQLLEFIDMEHTPKNILIRATRHKKMMPAAADRQKREAYQACRDFLGVKPTLERLLGKE